MLLQRTSTERPAELVEVAERLDVERRRLSGLIARLRATQSDDSSGGVDPPFAGVARHPADQASDTFEREANATLLEDVHRELDEVDRAIRKLAVGAYGRCARCHEPIGEARLAALPAARFCVRDEERFELDDRRLLDPFDWAPDAEPTASPARLDLWDATMQDDDGEPVDEPGAEDAAITVRDVLDLDAVEGWGAILWPVAASTSGAPR
jgi:RNA polymerase-binding transcription factor DksA